MKQLCIGVLLMTINTAHALEWRAIPEQEAIPLSLTSRNGGGGGTVNVSIDGKIPDGQQGSSVQQYNLDGGKILRHRQEYIIRNGTPHYLTDVWELAEDGQRSSDGGAGGPAGPNRYPFLGGNGGHAPK